VSSFPYTEAYLGESIELLRSLIRIDTTNPPGNEGKASEHLKNLFDSEGIDCTVVGPAPRESFVATLKGTEGKPRLLLLSHLDVVGVTDVSKWKHPPFAGDADEEWVYGRGSSDDKFDATVEAMTVIAAKRGGRRLRGTLIYAATADEEAGGKAGAGWLTENRPSLVKADYVLTEGGGDPVQVGGKALYAFAYGEKGIAWFRLRALGKSGHGSVPTLGDNAAVKMAKAFTRLAAAKTRVKVTEQVREALRAYIAASRGDMEAEKVAAGLDARSIDAFLDEYARENREVAEQFRALTRMTISPNVLRSGVKTNIIPDVAEAEVDTRILPGEDYEYALRVIERSLRGTGVEAERLDYTPPSASPTATRFCETLERVLKAMAPNAVMVSRLSTGMTDSRFLRALGAEAYGFIPMHPETSLKEIAPGVHGDNEKVNVKSLRFATEFLLRAAKETLS